MTQRQRQRGSDTAWTPAQLAAELGVTVEFVRREIKYGELRAVKVGKLRREYRIPTLEVIRYLKVLGWPMPDALQKTS